MLKGGGEGRRKDCIRIASAKALRQECACSVQRTARRPGAACVRGRPGENWKLGLTRLQRPGI